MADVALADVAHADVAPQGLEPDAAGEESPHEVSAGLRRQRHVACLTCRTRSREQARCRSVNGKCKVQSARREKEGFCSSGKTLKSPNCDRQI